MRPHTLAPGLCFGLCAASLTASIAGCTVDTDDDGPVTFVPTDTGAADSGETDTGTQDAEATDTGELDAGETDTGEADGGAQDTGTTDAATDVDVGRDADAGAVVTVPGYDGTWHDDGARQHDIAGGAWQITTSGASNRYVVLSADGGVVVAENDAGNPLDAGLFSRFDLVEDTDRGVMLCETTHTATTAEEAAAAASPDASDLATGCNGTAWFDLVEGPEPIELFGMWDDGEYVWNFSYTSLVVQSAGQTRRYSIRAVDNAAGRMTGRATSTSDLDPDTWVQFAWFRDEGDALWICGYGLGAPSRGSAEAAVTPDPSEPASRGCNGGPWTALTP